MTLLNIAFTVVVAIVAGVVGFLFGRNRINRAVVSMVLQQVHYWRYRYYETLNDIQEMEEERAWIEDWCTEEDDD